MRYTNLLFTAVKNTYQKRDSGSSGPSDMSNKYHGIDTCSSSPREAMLYEASTNSNNMLNTGLARRIPTITLNDDEVPLVSFDSSISDPFADPDPFTDPPDSTPVLDLSTLRSNAAALRMAINIQAQAQTSLQTPSEQHHPFRVIIVGGGPNGLVLAHALRQAGIDYTLLERSPIVPTTPNNNSSNEDGTGLVLWPHSARILDQLGLLRRAQRLSCAMRTRQTHRADGAPYLPSGDNTFSRARHDHGRPCMLISRAALLGLLWEALPEREARVCPGKEVVSVETHAAGVRVTCSDGSVEEGSVVVGCDGVHGVVRRAVTDLRAQRKSRRLSLGFGGGSDRDGKPDRDMQARYYGLIGSAPLLDGLEPGVCYETQGDATGKTFQVLAGEDTAYFLVYIPLGRPTRKQTKYTAQNAEYLASALAQHPVTDKIKFGDLWRARRSGKMMDFHEGIAEKWYHERVVMAGDAAHSMMPALGLGVNAGWQGVAELTNGLRRLLHHSQPSSSNAEVGGGQGPDTASIKRVFKAYQNDCDAMARSAMLISSFYTQAIAHQSLRTTLDSFYGWATPALADVALMERQVACAVRLGTTLDFVEEKHFKEGALKWANPRRRADAAAFASAGEEQRRTVFVYPGIPMRVRAT